MTANLEEQEQNFQMADIKIMHVMVRHFEKKTVKVKIFQAHTYNVNCSINIVPIGCIQKEP